MRLLVLNPNTTATMTDRVVAEVLRLAPTGLRVRGLTAIDGPPVIASRESFEAGALSAERSLRGLLEETDADRPDAVLLACFGDPGLADLQALSPVPVVGMADAALHEAAALDRPFHVITAGQAWDALLRETIAGHPRASRLRHDITVLDTTGLAVSRDPARFTAVVQDAIDGLGARGWPTCILGGSGFAGLLPALRYRGPLIDGTGAALRAAMQAHGARSIQPPPPSPRLVTR